MKVEGAETSFIEPPDPLVKPVAHRYILQAKGYLNVSQKLIRAFALERRRFKVGSKHFPDKVVCQEAAHLILNLK